MNAIPDMIPANSSFFGFPFCSQAPMKNQIDATEKKSNGRSAEGIVAFRANKGIEDRYAVVHKAKAAVNRLASA